MKKNRADILVFNQNIANSREKAKRLIMAGKMYVGEQKVLKPGDMFEEGTIFTLRGEEEKFVSRGGYKLEKALEEFDINLKGKICGDFGASTGGFTDCMLQNGASKVYAIDVGYGQLDWKIRSNPNVVTIERTNIRHLDNKLIDEKLDFISIDVSFISLTLILPKAFEILDDNGSIVGLIKPQFEASKSEVGKKGIVRDDKVKINAINKIFEFVVSANYTIKNLTFSPITGAGGNIEFLIEISKNGASIQKEMVEEVVRSSNHLVR
ncbi:MAG: TlyA family RNA methyltransferase [Tissierellia bacterium]|nr:TlyA family RNA methyltransferase [Tissierellia bacterium]